MSKYCSIITMITFFFVFLLYFYYLMITVMFICSIDWTWTMFSSNCYRCFFCFCYRFKSRNINCWPMIWRTMTYIRPWCNIIIDITFIIKLCCPFIWAWPCIRISIEKITIFFKIHAGFDCCSWLTFGSIYILFFSFGNCICWLCNGL